MCVEGVVCVLWDVYCDAVVIHVMGGGDLKSGMMIFLLAVALYVTCEVRLSQRIVLVSWRALHEAPVCHGHWK